MILLKRTNDVSIKTVIETGIGILKAKLKAVLFFSRVDNSLKCTFPPARFNSFSLGGDSLKPGGLRLPE